MKNIFLLSWKKFGLIILSWVAAVTLHNLFYGLFGFEEPVFFIMAVLIIPFYFLVCIFSTILLKMRKNGHF